jgi:hypothetical protein
MAASIGAWGPSFEARRENGEHLRMTAHLLRQSSCAILE